MIKEESRFLPVKHIRFKSQAVLDGQNAALQEQFEAPVREAYSEMLQALKGRKPDLAALAKQYQQVTAQDYFQSPLGEQVRKQLLSARGGKR